MTIDANVYWVPEALFEDQEVQDAFIRSVPREYDVHAIAYVNDQGDKAIKIEKPAGCENLNYFASDYKLEKQLADMDEAGVDKAVMKLPGAHRGAGQMRKRAGDDRRSDVGALRQSLSG